MGNSQNDHDYQGHPSDGTADKERAPETQGDGQGEQSSNQAETGSADSDGAEGSETGEGSTDPIEEGISRRDGSLSDEDEGSDVE